MEISNQVGAKRKCKQEDKEFGPEESAPAMKKQAQSMDKANQPGMKKGGLSRQLRINQQGLVAGLTSNSFCISS